MLKGDVPARKFPVRPTLQTTGGLSPSQESHAESHTEVIQYIPYGAYDDLFYRIRDPEILVEGPAGSGKTYGILQLFHAICQRHAKVRVLVCRKTLKSLTSTALVTFREKVLHPAEPVQWFGGSPAEPASFRYPNGSRIVVGGLDNPEKILSSEYDLGYVNECTEIREEDWETLTTRLRNGRLKNPRLYGDCNPTSERNWANQRCLRGLTRRVRTTHEDNPTITEEYLATLDRLSGTRYDRFRLGLWVGVENAIYENLDPSIQLRGIEEKTSWGIGAIGFDYGRRHLSASVVVQRDGNGYFWVRECWTDEDKNAQKIENAVNSQKTRYGIRRVRVDPVQGMGAELMGWTIADGSSGSRKKRVSYVRALLENGSLFFDIDGKGVRELFDEAMDYHYVEKESDTRRETVVARVDDDRVAALEYAIEELMEADRGLKYQITKPPEEKQGFINRFRRRREPVKAFRGF